MTMDDARRAEILLNELHHSGYDVRAEQGQLVITPEPDAPLLAYVAPYREALLRMLEAQKAAIDAMKGKP
jgi:apolipoprotein N-acyltransferase